MTTAPQDAPLTIQTIDRSALELVLSDGTVWNVDEDDRATLDRWQEEQRVLIRSISSVIYPYHITNRDTRTSVQARELPPRS